MLEKDLEKEKALEKDFVWTNLGMLILCEALHRLRLEQFLSSMDWRKYDQLWQGLEDLELSFSKPKMFNEVQNAWSECKKLTTIFTLDLEYFIIQVSACNKQFRYWSIFLDELTPAISDLALSFWERWSVSLSICLKKSNASIFHNWSNQLFSLGCVILPWSYSTWRNIYRFIWRFMKGDFTVKGINENVFLLLLIKLWK